MTPEQEARIVLDYDAEFTDALLFGTKACSTCGRKLPKCSPYYTPDARYEDGLRSECHNCISGRQRTRSAPETRPVADRFVDGALCTAVVKRLQRRGLTLNQISSGSGVSVAALTSHRKAKGRETLRRLVEFSESLKRRAS